MSKTQIKNVNKVTYIISAKFLQIKNVNKVTYIILPLLCSCTLSLLWKKITHESNFLIF